MAGSCRRYRITGRVQGVGFRAAACHAAWNLGLTGWVRNLPDGDVEALACGEAEKVQAFEQWLRQGPRGARVTNVTGVDAPHEACTTFEIDY